MSIADWHVSVVSPTGVDPATGEPIYAKKALASEETQQAILAAVGGGQEHSHLCATVTASGQTTIYTPAAGKCVRLAKVIALNDPNATNSAWFKLFLGAGVELFRFWALSTSVQRTGAVNAPLIIEASTTCNLQVTIFFDEVDP